MARTMGVALDVLADQPGETQVGHLGIGGLALRYDLPLILIQAQRVAVLDQQASDDIFEVFFLVAFAVEVADLQQADVAAPSLAGLDYPKGFRLERRRQDDLGEETARAGVFSPSAGTSR